MIVVANTAKHKIMSVDLVVNLLIDDFCNVEHACIIICDLRG